MEPNKDYRAITNTELNQTSVYRFKNQKIGAGKRTGKKKQNKQKIMSGLT